LDFIFVIKIKYISFNNKNWQKLKEIRFHGRGGQGAVTAATILAVAGFYDGKFTQAFPMFGVERRGAPVQAFTRISDEFIRERNAVYAPDFVVVLDSTLVEVVDIFDGIKKGGTAIINTEKPPSEFKIPDVEIFTIDVSKYAFEVLGADIVNTGILGAFSAFTKIVTKESIFKGVMEHFHGDIAERNINLVEKIYEQALRQRNGKI